MSVSDCVKQSRMEHVVFMRWINFVLQSCGRSNSIKNVHLDLSDGVALIDVLECITGKQIDSAHRNVTLHKQKVENIILVLQFLESENVEMMSEISEYTLCIHKLNKTHTFDANTRKSDDKNESSHYVQKPKSYEQKVQLR